MYTELSVSKMLPKIFAIYRQETETFQLMQAELDEEGEIHRLKGWRPPMEETDTGNDSTWSLGQEWYVDSTVYKGQYPIVHATRIHSQSYTWWSGHHKLVWSNYAIFDARNTDTHTWNSCHSIPILELNNKLIYPREYVSVHARWAPANPQELEEELERGRHANTISHVDPSLLRIQTPKETGKTTYKRRIVTPTMPSDVESEQDVYEWDSEFTPCAPKAPKHVRMGKHLDYVYDSPEELDRSWTPCMALLVLGSCFLGTWSLIGLSLLGL
jgi:hypothetical protein